MLNLPNLRNLLLQVLDLPALHTAVLFTPEGHLVTYASDPTKQKDGVRVIVGLSGEVWQETKEQGIGMVDSELGRILVLPIGLWQHDEHAEDGHDEEHDPLMLLALNAESSVSWAELESKARELGKHLETPVAQLRGRLAAAPALSPPRPEVRVAR
ncbi:hypothetical protein CERSUDRAFT_110846 [Gelatoporia subvermispora B]|uniref:Roadblock/LAMTOR2 domain-containing protein n=1 Tax=Ceriporiopsis subvermispora (strain B) TaxID=914234 RepID=M2QYT8_CERS8|nr:hypothetical protein CERSUDRAFT_110846 [Gelatoporia subvermispora B]